jgi:hypothetical protein
MQVTGRAARPGARPSIALACATILAVLGVLGPMATAAATPPYARKHTPTSTPSPAQTVHNGLPKQLPIDLNLLGIKLNVTVPLTLPGLLGVSGSPTTTPPPPPTSSPPPPTNTPARPPSDHTPAQTTTRQPQTSTPNQGGGGFAAGGPVASPTPTSHRTQHPSTPSASKTKQDHLPPGGLVLNKRILPTNDAILLISILVITSIGVAFLLRLSGRRGDRVR